MTGAAELFTSPVLAAGYARDRPPVHEHLLARVPRDPAILGPSRVALDVGCGAGASTVALRELARRRIGMDPAAAMIAVAGAPGDDAVFVVGAAERMPVATGSVDLVGAAGVLNFVDLRAFVSEADRVLTAAGTIVVSDYGFGVPGASTDWPERFARQWPRPAAASVDASVFVDGPFAVVVDEAFAVALPMTRAAYLAYARTDTRVAHAAARGTPIAEVAEWCDRTLAAWADEGPVTFAATLLVLRRISRT